MIRWWEKPGIFDPANWESAPLVHRNGQGRVCCCDTCTHLVILLTYMFEAMEPTDRALRPAGDIYPARRPA